MVKVTLSILCAALCLNFAQGAAPRPSEAGARHSPILQIESDQLNLPASFIQLIRDREKIDAYQASHHRVEVGISPVPVTAFTVRNRNPNYVRVVQPKPSADVLKYRSGFDAAIVPLRGYRAPILNRATMRPAVRLDPDKLSNEEGLAADYVLNRLAHDGLLSTLVQVVKILGPASLTNQNSAAGFQVLEAIGFPVDLLACFPLSAPGAGSDYSWTIIHRVAKGLAAGRSVVSIQTELHTLAFRFARTDPEFRVATESGELELGLIRVQAGGGYGDGGIIPGASLDVISQMANALPSVDLLISLPEEFLQPFHQIASTTWRLRRTNHVTLVGEPLGVAAWAQDNGKSGSVRTHADTGDPLRKMATLTPRYACMDEGKSTFAGEESFLMDGLQAAGHTVVQSSLLFEGGNLLAIYNPKSKERILLLGEGEVYRNMALGLSRSQTIEAFRAEFGVDRCILIPGGSYHLDFDTCARTHNGEVIAFVNDTMAATRIILGLGIDALQRHGTFDVKTAQQLHLDLAAGRDQELLQRLRAALPTISPGGAGHPATLSRYFASGKVDSAAGNLQCFLLALDWLESSLLVAPPAKVDNERSNYLLALRRLHMAHQAQIAELESQDWKVVRIPSMPDLYRSINYINGIHHKNGYIMPVFGGFYAPLDEVAMAAFRSVLGSEFKITAIQSAECQRQHGGVHCTTAVYPKL